MMMMRTRTSSFLGATNRRRHHDDDDFSKQKLVFPLSIKEEPLSSYSIAQHHVVQKTSLNNAGALVFWNPILSQARTDPVHFIFIDREIKCVLLRWTARWSTPGFALIQLWFRPVMISIASHDSLDICS